MLFEQDGWKNRSPHEYAVMQSSGKGRAGHRGSLPPSRIDDPSVLKVTSATRNSG